MDAKERPRRSHQTLIFKPFFACFVLRVPLGGRPQRVLHFENEQKRIGFIHVFDALIESMLDHRTVAPKSKNERHAAWEHDFWKNSKRHAAWERSRRPGAANATSRCLTAPKTNLLIPIVLGFGHIY